VSGEREEEREREKRTLGLQKGKEKYNGALEEALSVSD
jgi:hypothetical protein